LGLTIVVPPEVMPVTPVSHLLGEAVLAQVRTSGDLGCGRPSGTGLDHWGTSS
jgi:release factor glutamine methyltransferase